MLGWSLHARGIIIVKSARTYKRGWPHGEGAVGKYIIWKHGCSFHSVLSREAGLGLALGIPWAQGRWYLGSADGALEPHAPWPWY